MAKFTEHFAYYEARAKKAAQDAAKRIAHWQAELIYNEQKPDGSPQQRSKWHDRRKQKPMYRSGRFANPKTWRIGTVRNHVRLRPAKDREMPIHVIMTFGYSTVFDREYVRHLEDIIQKAINEALKK